MQIRRHWRFAAACFVLATATAMATVAATVAAAQAKAPAAWRLDPGGFGPYRVGMSLAQVRKRAPGMPLNSDQQVDGSCKQLPLPGYPGVVLMFVDDVLTRVDLFEPGPRTTRGIGPGDRVDQAMRAYPGLEISPRAYDAEERFLTARSGANAIRFETEKGRIQNIYAGRWAEVQYIEGCL
jgi:hypothetical protein